MSTLPVWARWAGVAAAVFGAATVFAGGAALFGGQATEAAVGDAVPVVWFNFCAGFAYLIGAATLIARAPVARIIALLIGLLTLAVFALFIFKVVNGTPFEWRTVGAMTLRSGFWLAIGFALPKT
jgi:hypothetical protein